MKRTLINLAKYGVSFAIVAYLVYDAQRDKTFATIRDSPKDWRLFALAWAACMAAACLTFVRWFYLVRALALPFRMSDAFRLGFLGYLLNFVSLGNVGGDLFKAVFIAREQKGKRAEAVATVVVDRVIGLYVLFVVAAAAILVTGLLGSDIEEVRVISRVTILCTVLGAVFIGALLIPGVTQGRMSALLSGLPRVGYIFGRLLGAIRMYRARLGVIALACAISVVVHILNTVGIYLVARGLPGDVPSLGMHFIIVSLGMVAGALPLPLSGFGAFEGALDFLYRAVTGGAETPRAQGLVVAFGYRAITIVIALVGVCFYLRSRRDVAAALEEAEHIAEEEPREAAADPQLRQSGPAVA